MKIESDLIRQLNEADIYAYITYLKKQNHDRQITVNRKISVLKQYFKYLKANHYLENNLVYDIKLNKPDAVGILTLDECQTLLNSVSGRNKTRDTLIIMLFLFAQ